MIQYNAEESVCSRKRYCTLRSKFVKCIFLTTKETVDSSYSKFSLYAGQV